MELGKLAILLCLPALGCGSDENPGGPTAVAGQSGMAGASAGTGGAAGAGGAAAGGKELEPTAPLELPLLIAADPSLPFQHSAEVQVAAYQQTVAFAFINLHHDAGGTLAATNLRRRVGVVVSRDGGRTLEPPVELVPSDPESSDPVLRVGENGVFWASVIGIDGDTRRGLLWRSEDRASTWQVVQQELPIVDKQWIAVAPNGEPYLGSFGGFWRFNLDGSVAASWLLLPDWPVSGGFAEDDAAYFALISGNDTGIARWIGEEDLEFVGSVSHNYNTWSLPVGRAASGEFWALAATRSLDLSQSLVELHLFSEGGEARKLPLSDPAATAFLPGATRDAQGRLHVIWYESSADAGVLKYARSLSANLDGGFEPARVIDPVACPAGHWYPVYASNPLEDPAAGDRRLREYVDVAVDGDRVHLAWTRAGALPTRVQTSFVDL